MAYNTCVELLGPLLDALGELDSRLDVGLNIGEYGDLVADANVIYDRVEFDQFGADGLTCLSEVGLPLEEALNKYFQAHQIWDDCIEDAACSTDSITTRLQRLWAQAETSISDARDSMSDLRGP